MKETVSANNEKEIDKDSYDLVCFATKCKFFTCMLFFLRSKAPRRRHVGKTFFSMTFRFDYKNLCYNISITKKLETALL